MDNESQRIDLNQDDVYDVVYDRVGSGPFDSFPTRWDVVSSIAPRANERLVIPSGGRVLFGKDESIGGTSIVHQHTVLGTVVYGMGLISYSASSYTPRDPCCWEYKTIDDPTPFNEVREALIGVRLAAGDDFHYGWIRLSRSVVDNHTLFEVTGWDWNRIPNSAIGAGEPPPPPPLQASMGDAGELTFDWDNRNGEMVLEWSDSLTPPVEWKPVVDSGWPPVMLAMEGAGRFFRLRRP